VDALSKIDAPTLLANLLCSYRAESEMERIGHKKISLLGRMSLLILVGGAGWAAGSAQAGDEMPGNTGDAGKSNDNELRSQATQPSEKLSALVEEYRTQDSNASFSFFNGHIDSFFTTPKETIPEYAVKTLKGRLQKLSATRLLDY